MHHGLWLAAWRMTPFGCTTSFCAVCDFGGASLPPSHLILDTFPPSSGWSSISSSFRQDKPLQLYRTVLWPQRQKPLEFLPDTLSVPRRCPSGKVYKRRQIRWTGPTGAGKNHRWKKRVCSKDNAPMNIYHFHVLFLTKKSLCPKHHMDCGVSADETAALIICRPSDYSKRSTSLHSNSSLCQSICLLIPV